MRFVRFTFRAPVPNWLAARIERRREAATDRALKVRIAMANEYTAAARQAHEQATEWAKEMVAKMKADEAQQVAEIVQRTMARFVDDVERHGRRSA